MVTWDSHRVDAHEAKLRPKHQQPTGVEGVKLEADLHDKIEAELKRRRIYYVHSRMDRATTTQLGVTDFVIAMPNGKTLWMECKRHGGKLSTEQNITRHVLLASGHWHEVVYSMKQFLELL